MDPKAESVSIRGSWLRQSIEGWVGEGGPKEGPKGVIWGGPNGGPKGVQKGVILGHPMVVR
jgi:hypothetical protein